MIKLVFGSLFLCFSLVTSKLEPFIVGGEFSDIKDFPHSVCLFIDHLNVQWKCGGSILNQRIVLTAAHCIHNFPTQSIHIMYGNTHLSRMMNSTVLTYVVNENYEEWNPNSDIALVLTAEPFKFSSSVRRVAILPWKHTPYDEVGLIAGWGMVNEIQEISTDRLKHIQQYIVNRTECSKLMGEMLNLGVICAYGVNEDHYASGGDSGSALVVRNYIQVGIVSYKQPDISRAIVMYTDVGFYYNWIRDNAHKLFCLRKMNN